MKCAVIFNPNSGKAKKKHIDYVCKVLASKYDVQSFATAEIGDATKIANAICKDFDIIVSCGGDDGVELGGRVFAAVA